MLRRDWVLYTQIKNDHDVPYTQTEDGVKTGKLDRSRYILGEYITGFRFMATVNAKQDHTITI